MTLPRVIKYLGIVGVVLYICITYYVSVNVVLPVVLDVIKEKVPEIYYGQVQSLIYSSIIIGSIIGTIIAWGITSAILYGLLKAFRISAKYLPTLLITGHAFYLSTISTSITFLNPSTIQNYLKMKIIPTEMIITGIIIGIVLTSTYLSFLLSKEYETKYIKTLIPTITSMTILYLLGLTQYLTFKP